jgi:hypothetical protein
VNINKKALSLCLIVSFIGPVAFADPRPNVKLSEDSSSKKVGSEVKHSKAQKKSREKRKLAQKRINKKKSMANKKKTKKMRMQKQKMSQKKKRSNKKRALKGLKEDK